LKWGTTALPLKNPRSPFLIEKDSTERRGKTCLGNHPQTQVVEPSKLLFRLIFEGWGSKSGSQMRQTSLKEIRFETPMKPP